MVFARKSRSEPSSQQGAPDRRKETAEGRFVDPFAAEQTLPDASELAEKVVFKLWSEGAVKGKAIEQARREAGDKMRIDQALTRLRLADPEEVATALAELLEAPMATDRDYPGQPVSADTLPSRFVREALALPLFDDGAVLGLAMADPLDDYALRAIAMKTRRKLAVKVACANRLELEIDRLYPLANRKAQRALPAPERDVAARAPIDAPKPQSRRPEPDPQEAPPRQQRSASGWSAPNFLRRRKKDQTAAPSREAARPRSTERRSPPPMDDAREEPSARSVARGLARDAEHSSPGRPEPGGFSQPAADRRAATPRQRTSESRTPQSRTPPRDEVRVERHEESVEASAPERQAPPRPKFIRPKRVTLKNKTDQAAVSRGAVKTHKRAARRAPPPEALQRREALQQEAVFDERPPGAEAPGSVAAQVREQVAARRAERERAAAEGRGVGPFPDDLDDAQADAPRKSSASSSIQVRGLSKRDMRERVEDPTPVGSDLAMPMPSETAERSGQTDETPSIESDAPLRFGELRGHAAAARAKSSPSRRKVLDKMRDAIAARKRVVEPQETPAVAAPVPEPTAKPEAKPEQDAQYQAASAMKERGHNVAEPEPAVRMPRVETLKRFGFGRKAAPAPAPQEEPDLPPAAAPAEAPKRPEPPVRDNAPSAADESGLGVPGLAVDPSARAALDDAKSAQDGLVLLAGPSGSGKIETVRKLAEHCGGRQVAPKRFDEPGVKFPRDVAFRVYWGEIRDAESAEAAARAAMTGALVVATLDAASAPASPNRLVALGLPPYALASSLRAVLSQYMDETVCTRCAGTGRAAKGGVCPECGGEGRLETVRIGESMLLDDALRALILSGAPEEAFRHAIRAAAKKSAPATAKTPRRRRGKRDNAPDNARL